MCILYVNLVSWKAIQYIVRDTHSNPEGTGVHGVMRKRYAEYAEQNMISKNHVTWNVGKCIATIISRNVLLARASVVKHAMTPIHVVSNTKRSIILLSQSPSSCQMINPNKQKSKQNMRLRLETQRLPIIMILPLKNLHL